MKIRVLFVISAFILALTGCSQTEQESLKVYSFKGENELFSISNGIIVLDDKEEIFRGGDLKVINNDFTDIKSYSTTFYIQSNDEKYTILSHNAPGDSIGINSDLGQISSESIFEKTELSGEMDLQNNLYFELKTIDEEDEEHIYPLQLSVTEVTEDLNH